MPWRRALVRALNLWLRPIDAEIVRASELDRLRDLSTHSIADGAGAAASLPPEVTGTLRRDHPRLLEIHRRYQKLASAALDPSVWHPEFIRRDVDLLRFRGDGAFLWQDREGNSDWKYLLTTYFLGQIDSLGLLERLREDGSFGARTLLLPEGRAVSRDLLDSIAEIHFLERHLEISGWRDVDVLDIGAGYGRLAHRLAEALPELGRTHCVDAIAESSFLSEFYLRFRGVAERAPVVLLDEIERHLGAVSFHLAINVHSFSECTLAAIGWWIERIARARVPYLMIVPSPLDNGGTRLLSTEKDRSHHDFLPVLQASGYQLLAEEPKYSDPRVQRHGVSPTLFYLFRLSG